jgi:hypothetical protein
MQQDHHLLKHWLEQWHQSMENDCDDVPTSLRAEIMAPFKVGKKADSISMTCMVEG